MVYIVCEDQTLMVDISDRDSNTPSLIPSDGSEIIILGQACPTHRTKFSLQAIEPRNLRNATNKIKKYKHRTSPAFT